MHRKNRNAALTLLLLLSVVILSPRALGQDARLKTPVELQLGQTTLAEVARALTAQSGIKVEAAPYLRARKLVVSIPRSSTAGVLNALAELNEWSWRMVGEDGVLIERARPPAPRNVAEVPQSVQKALPADLKRYLGVGVPLETLATAHPGDGGRRSVPDPGMDERERRYSPAKARLDAKIRTLTETLWAGLSERLGREGQTPFAELTPQQKEDLTTLPPLLAIAATFRGMSSRILYDLLLPYEKDLSAVAMSLQNGNWLEYGMWTQEGKARVFRGSAVEIK